MICLLACLSKLAVKIILISNSSIASGADDDSIDNLMINAVPAITTASMLQAICLIALAAFMCRFGLKYWWAPRRMRTCLERQGLKGPPPKFLVGNMLQVSQLRESTAANDMTVGDHDLLPRICPHFSHWSAIYGRRFLFWWGTEPRVTVVEPDLIKEILLTKAQYFGKSMLQKKGGMLLLGNGLVYANGEDWAHRRRIIGPAFHIDKLKGMVTAMVKSTQLMLDKWSMCIESAAAGDCAEIDVNYYLSMATADVIARTAFGSGHEKGKRVFEHLTCLQKVFAQSNRYLWLPCSRLLPTTVNKRASKIKGDIEEALKDLVKERRESKNYGNDFLGLMLSEQSAVENKKEMRMMMKMLTRKKKFQLQTNELVEECKTIFFTGHETTSALLTWTLMLLALHPEWQERGRKEVEEVCRGEVPDSEMLNKLKTLGMILNETLRLYPPAPALVREALDEMNLGGMLIPKGTTFWIPILAVHHDRSIWGNDASEFKPQRFAEGVSKACCNHQMQFMPFSFGPRACVGQTFAIMEAKVVLAMILHKFSFTLSTNYRHTPVTAITLKPRHGMQLIMSHVSLAS